MGGAGHLWAGLSDPWAGLVKPVGGPEATDWRVQSSGQGWVFMGRTWARQYHGLLGTWHIFVPRILGWRLSFTIKGEIGPVR